jgi:hypothetical protein
MLLYLIVHYLMHILTTMFSDEGIQKFSSAATDEVAKGQAAKHQLGMSLYTY